MSLHADVDKTYADFKLVIEFRFLEEKANSGIFVRTGPTSKKDKNGWPDNGYHWMQGLTLGKRSQASSICMSFYAAVPMLSRFGQMKKLLVVGCGCFPIVQTIDGSNWSPRVSAATYILETQRIVQG